MFEWPARSIGSSHSPPTLLSFSFLFPLQCIPFAWSRSTVSMCFSTLSQCIFHIHSSLFANIFLCLTDTTLATFAPSSSCEILAALLLSVYLWFIKSISINNKRQKFDSTTAKNHVNLLYDVCHQRNYRQLSAQKTHIPRVHIQTSCIIYGEHFPRKFSCSPVSGASSIWMWLCVCAVRVQYLRTSSSSIFVIDNYCALQTRHSTTIWMENVQRIKHR